MRGSLRKVCLIFCTLALVLPLGLFSVLSLPQPVKAASLVTMDTDPDSSPLSYDEFMKAYIAKNLDAIKEKNDTAGGSANYSIYGHYSNPDYVPDHANEFDAFYDSAYSAIGDAAGIDCNFSSTVGSNLTSWGSCGTDASGMVYNLRYAMERASGNITTGNSAKFYEDKAYNNLGSIEYNMALAYMDFKILSRVSAPPAGSKGVLTDLDTNNSKRIHKVAITDSNVACSWGIVLGGPPGIAACLVVGKVTLSSDDNHIYDSMASFYADLIQIMHVTVVQHTAFVEKEFTAGQSVDKAMAHFLESRNGGGSTLHGLNDDWCGDQPGNPLDIAGNMLFSMCEMIYNGYQFSVNFTASSALLYGKAAGLETAGTVSKGQTTLFKDWISADDKNALGVGKFQNLMVDTTSAYGTAVQLGWRAVLGLVDTFLVLLFIIVALANILQINMSAYAIKKMLPGLILGFLMATASWFMVRAMLEVSGAVALSFFGPQTTTADLSTDKYSTATLADKIVSVGALACPTGVNCPHMQGADNKPDFGLMMEQVIFNVLMFAGGIMLFWLAMLYIFRNLVFAVLVPIAPLAFFGLTFEPMNSVWKQWWKTAMGWIWMPVVTNFWIWMAFTFLGVGKSVGSTNLGALTMYAAAIAFMYMAVKTPFSMAGEAANLMKMVGKVGQGTGNFAKGLAGNAALRFTPAGMAVRGFNNYKTMYQDRAKQLRAGPTISNQKLADTAVGRTVNRHVEKMKANNSEAARNQKTITERAESEAKTLQGTRNRRYEARMRTLDIREEENSQKKRVSEAHGKATKDEIRKDLIENDATFKEKEEELARLEKTNEILHKETHEVEEQIKLEAELHHLGEASYRARLEHLHAGEMHVEQMKKEVENANKTIEFTTKQTRLNETHYRDEELRLETEKQKVAQLERGVTISGKIVQSEAELNLSRNGLYQDVEDTNTAAETKANQDSSQAKVNHRLNFINGGRARPGESAGEEAARDTVASRRRKDSFEDSANKALVTEVQTKAERRARLEVLHKGMPGPGASELEKKVFDFAKDAHREDAAKLTNKAGSPIFAEDIVYNRDKSDWGKEVNVYKDIVDGNVKTANLATARRAMGDLLHVASLFQKSKVSQQDYVKAFDQLVLVKAIDPSDPKLAKLAKLHEMDADQFDDKQREILKSEFAQSDFGMRMAEIQAEPHKAMAGPP